MSEHYKIIEGTPSYVADVCEAMIQQGWQCNGALSVFSVGERIIAFQGMVHSPTKTEKSIPSLMEPQ